MAPTENPFEGFVSGESLDGVPVTPEAKEEPKTPNATPEADDSDETSEAHDTAADVVEGEETEAEDTAEADDVESDVDTEPKPQPKPKSKDVNQRIAKLIRARHEAERRAETAERALASRNDTAQKKDLTTPQGDSKDTAEVAPDPDKFDYGELDPKYIAALHRFEAKQAIAAEQAAQTEQRQREADERAAQEYAQKTPAIVAKGQEKYDDFDEVVHTVASGAVPIADALWAKIVNSEHAHDMVYHLGSNIPEAYQVAVMPPAGQDAYFKRLEKRFSSQQVKKPAPDATPEAKPSKAPAPPAKQPRGAGGKFSVGPDTEDFSAFEAMVNRKG